MSIARLPAFESTDRRPAAEIRFGVIGYGYWGPNIARNISGLDQGRLLAVCDRSSDALKRAGKVYPGATLTTDPTEILTSPHVDAVAVVTPVWTHYELAKAALEHGKHVFVEKPFTSTSRQAEELIEL
ncbi:MAG TPA: Gfo/Idh/MocA family oxidoreductase, partial [Vicinamibacterales bacterium]|nr:Gfo/Idh/MocA family oxidoreductase [Vicinamibacterales bacterium]